MTFLNFGKKKERVNDCNCNGTCNNKALSVKVLGSGCKNCTMLIENTKTALEQLGIDSEVEKVTDMAQIASYGVMSTPALVVDNKVVSYGKVLKADEVIRILQQVR